MPISVITSVGLTTVIADVAREALGEPLEPPLRARVDRLARSRVLPREAPDVDQRSRRLAEVRDRSTGDEERPVAVDGHHLSVLLGRELLYVAESVDARVGHDDVESTEALGGFLDGIVDLSVVRDVGRKDERLDAVLVLDRSREVPQSLLAPREERDVRALPREESSSRLSDTGARPGDERRSLR
jgi:hypothetical protein